MADIVVYGRGKTGKAIANMAQKLGFGSRFFDDNGLVKCCFAQGETVVLSPGVKPFAQGVIAAKQMGARVVSELDFCFPYCKARCVSVTGTNGKTTTCNMIWHILNCCKKSVFLLGNGGIPFAEHVLDTNTEDIVVLESSSFQLHNTKSFSPYISVLTNIAPDHLDYHGSFENYVAAKLNNFTMQGAGQFAIFNADDNLSFALSKKCAAQVLTYSVEKLQANCSFCNGVALSALGKQYKIDCEFLSKWARHNISNALCAVLVCFLLGVSPQESCAALQKFCFLPHRLQTVAEFCGVKFVDDSKATNVHATLQAIRCFGGKPLALIVGGSDKGEDFDSLFEGNGNIKFVCAVGQTAQKIAKAAARHHQKLVICNNYAEALGLCFEYVKGDGVVLMSNACASFDMFESYTQRGEHFVQLVEELRREKS